MSTGPAPVLTLQVKVKPNARASRLEAAADGSWRAELKSPPVDGRANEELVALLAKRFGCPRAAVEIRSGAGARLKLVKLSGVDPAAAAAAVQARTGE